jgi:hypothetical protein
VDGELLDQNIIPNISKVSVYLLLQEKLAPKHGIGNLQHGMPKSNTFVQELAQKVLAL